VYAGGRVEREVILAFGKRAIATIKNRYGIGKIIFAVDIDTSAEL
jgi:hypothetical protein